MFRQILRRILTPLAVVSAVALVVGRAAPVEAQALTAKPPSINFKVEKPNERLEMTVNSSRILSLDQKIPQAQVNNPDIVQLTALSPNEIQVSAKATGVTQVNLWGEDNQIYTVDVIVYADAQQLTMLLRARFPQASLEVIPVEESVLISGYVDQPEHVQIIVTLAEQFYPKVINNILVSGVQQVLLHVKVMEVSRTKLRKLGIDWGTIVTAGGFASTPSAIVAGAETLSFNILGGSGLVAVIEALREDSLMKILAEPNLVAVSGRPSFFHVGGDFAYRKSVTTDGKETIGFKSYGTRVDFVAIVLGNGRVRLEVRPDVTEIDWANAWGDIPATKFRKADTGVELQAGQTLAIAGLLQTRVDSTTQALPWIGEVPYLGTLFRRVKEERNEVELLILVTPELVEAMDADEVPPCGPGFETTSPSDFELFFQGHLEVPNCCPGGTGCQRCAPADQTSPTAPASGMILQQRGQPPQPQPTDSTGFRSLPAGRTQAALPASRNRRARPKPQASQTVLPSGQQNGAHGFIGPIGYDVVR